MQRRGRKSNESNSLEISIFAYDLFHPQIIDPGVCGDPRRLEPVGLVLARLSRRWRQVAISSRSHLFLIQRQQGPTASKAFDGWRPARCHHAVRCSQTPLPTVGFYSTDRCIVEKRQVHTRNARPELRTCKGTKKIVRNAIGNWNA